MSDCCDPIPYRRFFNTKEAERRLRNYRRRGLDGTATGVVDYLTRRGVSGLSVLEIGGGVGDLQIELLKRGARSSVNVELSSGYEEAARMLMEAEGLAGRMERRLGDFVEQQDSIEPADIVVLNRVICCYPWMERMMDAAVGKTGSLLALAVPEDRRLAHLFVGLGNLVNRVRGCGFQAYVHPVSAIEARAAGSGLWPVYADAGIVWRGMVFERAAA